CVFEDLKYDYNGPSIQHRDNTLSPYLHTSTHFPCRINETDILRCFMLNMFLINAIHYMLISSNSVNLQCFQSLLLLQCLCPSMNASQLLKMLQITRRTSSDVFACKDASF